MDKSQLVQQALLNSSTPIEEQTYHDPQKLHTVSRSIDSWNFNRSGPLEPDTPIGRQRSKGIIRNKTFESNHENLRVDATAQHERLQYHQYGTDDPYLSIPKLLTANHYTGAKSETINSYLIHKNQEHTYDKLEPHNRYNPHKQYAYNLGRKLSSEIKNNAKPLPEEVHTYSGTNIDMGKLTKVGGVIHLPAFTSTSLLMNKAFSFGGESKAKSNFKNEFVPTSTYSTERHIIHFYLPKGSKHGLYVDPISENPGEKEYLLNKGQNWKVVNHEVVKHTNINSDLNSTGKRNSVNKRIVHHHIWSCVPAD